jgi:hypothetical protein
MYVDVTVCVGDTTLELGLLTAIEAEALADRLREAADDIWPLDDEEGADG